MKLMNKKIFLILGIFIFTVQKAFCEMQAVSSELESSLKTHTNEPGVLSIIFALLVVIALIYITGLIYSKLNIVGAKAVQSQIKNQDLSRVVVLSTTQLGQGKNLHVIQLNNKCYLIGATQNSINLIKELNDVNTKNIKEEKEEESIIEKSPVDPMHVLYGKVREGLLDELKSAEEFDVHKKYL